MKKSEIPDNSTTDTLPDEDLCGAKAKDPTGYDFGIFYVSDNNEKKAL